MYLVNTRRCPSYRRFGPYCSDHQFLISFTNPLPQSRGFISNPTKSGNISLIPKEQLAWLTSSMYHVEIQVQYFRLARSISSLSINCIHQHTVSYRATLDLNLRHIGAEHESTHAKHSRDNRNKDNELRKLKKADLQLKVARESLEHSKQIHDKKKAEVSTVFGSK